MPFIVIYREAAIVRRSGKLFVWKSFDIPVKYLWRISLFIKAACCRPGILSGIYCSTIIDIFVNNILLPTNDFKDYGGKCCWQSLVNFHQKRCLLMKYLSVFLLLREKQMLHHRKFFSSCPGVKRLSNFAAAWLFLFLNDTIVNF